MQRKLGAFPFLRRVFSISMIPGQLITFLGPFSGSRHGRSVIFAPQGSGGASGAMATTRRTSVRAHVRGGEPRPTRDLYGTRRHGLSAGQGVGSFSFGRACRCRRPGATVREATAVLSQMPEAGRAGYEAEREITRA